MYKITRENSNNRALSAAICWWSLGKRQDDKGLVSSMIYLRLEVTKNFENCRNSRTLKTLSGGGSTAARSCVPVIMWSCHQPAKLVGGCM